MRVKEIIKIPKKDIVIPDYIMRPLEDENDKDIDCLSASIESNGLINEIDVRLINGRYELMAGARRFVATKENDVLAKVFEDVSDTKAMVMGLVENLQRKNPDINSRDLYIYKVWIKGKESGEFIYQKDLADEIGMTEGLLSVIIAAGEIKNKNASSIIKNATSWDLDRTKTLSEHTDLREEVLKKGQEDKMNTQDMEMISKEIKNEIDKGTKKDIIVKALDIADRSINKTVNKYLQSNSAAKSSGPASITPRVISKISDKTFSDVLDIYKKSAPEVREKLEKGDISIKDAKDVVDFSSKESREQVLKEIKEIENKKDTAQKIYDKDREMNLNIRKKQEKEIKEKGDTKLKSEFDKEYEEKLEKESNKDEIHDDDFINRYQRLSSYTLGAFTYFHPNQLRTEEGKKTVLEIIKNIYHLYHDVLVDIGEIKEVRISGSDRKDSRENIKYLETENANIM